MRKLPLLLVGLCCQLSMFAQLGPLQPILGGELSNSAATSVADIDEVMPRMARLG